MQINKLFFKNSIEGNKSLNLMSQNEVLSIICEGIAKKIKVQKIKTKLWKFKAFS